MLANANTPLTPIRMEAQPSLHHLFRCHRQRQQPRQVHRAQEPRGCNRGLRAQLWLRPQPEVT